MKKLVAIIFLALIVFAPLAAQKGEKVVAAASTETILSVIQTGKVLQLQNATVGEKLEVLSIVGVRIAEKKIESSNQSFTLELPKGYYIVKIGTAVRKISVK
ncbi:MAG TPA: T9SS type A sorting domain-containing protein [Bacteroidales bacterium]|nr:T9SS type A sorting domain-containing protein [Bacteroidales bacterium]